MYTCFCYLDQNNRVLTTEFGFHLDQSKINKKDFFGRDLCFLSDEEYLMISDMRMDTSYYVVFDPQTRKITKENVL